MKKNFVIFCGIILINIFLIQKSVIAQENNAIGFGYLESKLDRDTPVYISEIDTYSDDTIPGVYPDSIEVLKNNYPHLRNQGNYGTCWAFSSVGLAEFDLVNKNNQNKDIDFSELQLAYFTYNSVEDPLGGTKGDYTKYHGQNTSVNYLNAGGNYLWALKRFSQWVGATNESVVPYENATNSLSEGIDDEYAYGYNEAHLQNAYRINLKLQPDDVKKQIMEHGAVGISYYHHDLGSNYNNKSYYDYKNIASSISDGGHAVMIVGWDDNYSKDNFNETNKPSSDGAWLVRNSWGESGSYYNVLDYFWMSYETYSLNDTAWVFDFSSDDNLDNNYQLDAGLESQVDYNYNKVANVYTVEKKQDVEYEVLKSISLSFLYTSDVGYNIDIYVDLKDIQNPISGIKCASISGTTSYAGYYTIPIDEKIKIKPESSFSVVLETNKKAIEYEWTYSTANNINQENPEIIWERKVSSNKSSFYNGYGTYSVAPYDYCVKAFTANCYNESDYEPIKVGMNGDNVKEVQEYLKKLGYLSSAADGYYGNQTRASVIMFQANEGMDATGEVDSETYEKMKETENKFTSLKRGMGGNAVKEMQKYLKNLGYLTGPVDGGFGGVTESALKEFQQTNGLTVDGIAGLKTLIVLYGNSAKKKETTIKLGMNGDNVKEVQEYLKKLGYLSSVADGYYGNQTRASVIMFQANEGMGATGEVDSETYEKMKETEIKFTSLKRGMGGNAVKEMQKYLKNLGYLTGPVDGGFGGVTESALKEFQQANGLTVDGIAGLKTLTLLYNKTV